jgi:thiol-disulfide isomerase/thioredoxin
VNPFILAATLAFFFLNSNLLGHARTDASLNALFAAKDWVNGAPTRDSVSGKVVILDFYTFACMNCKNVEPNLRKLYRTTSRADLAIISVHSPETTFERVRGTLIASTKVQGVAWPVAIDNDFQIWNAFSVRAWPTQLIFDRAGRLRATIVGDSQDALVDTWVSRLIQERR